MRSKTRRNLRNHEAWFNNHKDELLAILESHASQPDWDKLREFNACLHAGDKEGVKSSFGGMSADTAWTSRIVSNWCGNMEMIMFTLQLGDFLTLLRRIPTKPSLLCWSYDLQAHVRKHVDFDKSINAEKIVTMASCLFIANKLANVSVSTDSNINQNSIEK